MGAGQSRQTTEGFSPADSTCSHRRRRPDARLKNLIFCPRVPPPPPWSISFHLPAYRAPGAPGTTRPAAAAPASRDQPDPATKLAVAAVCAAATRRAARRSRARRARVASHARKAHPTWLRRLDLQNALLGLDEPVRSSSVRRIAPASVLAAALAAQRDELLRPAPAPAGPASAHRGGARGGRGGGGRGGARGPSLAAAAPCSSSRNTASSSASAPPARAQIIGANIAPRNFCAMFDRHSSLPAGTASSSASGRGTERVQRQQRLDALHNDRGRKRARPGSTEPDDDDDGRRPSRPPALRPGRAKASFAATDLAAAPLAVELIEPLRSQWNAARGAYTTWPCRTARRGRRVRSSGSWGCGGRTWRTRASPPSRAASPSSRCGPPTTTASSASPRGCRRLPAYERMCSPCRRAPTRRAPPEPPPPPTQRPPSPPHPPLPLPFLGLRSSSCSSMPSSARRR